VSDPNTKLLYRYLDAQSALKSIESRSLRISRLHELNDPFEWRMGISGITPEGESLIEKWIAPILANQSKAFGLMCFSATFKEPVLWSHYADKHRGVAFEVEYDCKPDNPIEIKYPPERLVVDGARYADLQQNEPALREYLLPFMKPMMSRKSPSWEYEKEHRIYFDLSKEPNIKTSCGHYFIPIPDNFLTRVILGYKCPLEEQYVAKALQRSGLGLTKVTRAKISNETYEVRCD
jgi:hypothetical protein